MSATTDDLLVLHYAGPDTARTLDARAGVEELLKRCPGAEVVETVDLGIDDRTDPRDTWVLGLGDGPVWRSDVHRIDPTPDVSIVRQVWRKLYEKPCEDCGPASYHAHCIGGEIVGPDGCDVCGGHGVVGPKPPCHVRYIDDAVCKRWKLPHSREVWACLTNYEPRDAMALLRSWNDWKNRFVYEGNAILRARELWKEDQQSERDVFMELHRATTTKQREAIGELKAMLQDAEEGKPRQREIDALAEECARLRTEQNEGDSAGCVNCYDDRGPLAKWCRSCRDKTSRFRTERNEARAGLEDALERRIQAAMTGYSAGHDDTVEGRYGDPREVAEGICQDLDDERDAALDKLAEKDGG